MRLRALAALALHGVLQDLFEEGLHEVRRKADLLGHRPNVGQQLGLSLGITNGLIGVGLQVTELIDDGLSFGEELDDPFVDLVDAGAGVLQGRGCR
jgi:hypothetical protein